MNNAIYTCLLFFALNTAWAQQITGGIKAGANLTRLSVGGQQIDPVVRNDWVPSFHVGGYVRTSLGEGVALQTELLYSGKGCQFQERIGIDHLRLHYISLPVLLNLRVVNRLILEIGPEFNYLLNSGRGLYDNRFDLGIDVGLRYDLSQKVGLSVRHGFGVSSVTTLNFGTGSNQLRNQVLQASMNYRLF